MPGDHTHHQLRLVNKYEIVKTEIFSKLNHVFRRVIGIYEILLMRLRKNKKKTFLGIPQLFRLLVYMFSVPFEYILQGHLSITVKRTRSAGRRRWRHVAGSLAWPSHEPAACRYNSLITINLVMETRGKSSPLIAECTPPPPSPLSIPPCPAIKSVQGTN